MVLGRTTIAKAILAFLFAAGDRCSDTEEMIGLHEITVERDEKYRRGCNEVCPFLFSGSIGRGHVRGADKCVYVDATAIIDEKYGFRPSETQKISVLLVIYYERSHTEPKIRRELLPALRTIDEIYDGRAYYI